MLFDLETIRAGVTVGASVAELVAGIIGHIRGGSAVDVRPRLDEIENALPELVHAVRHGTAAEDEAEPAERDEDDDPANAGAAQVEPEAGAGAGDGGPDAEAEAEAEDKAAADTAGDTTAAQDPQA